MTTAIHSESTTTTVKNDPKFSSLDLIVLNLSQPRNATWYIADALVKGAATAVSYMAIQAAVNKLKERKQAKLELVNPSRKLS